MNYAKLTVRNHDETESECWVNLSTVLYLKPVEKKSQGKTRTGTKIYYSNSINLEVVETPQQILVESFTMNFKDS